MFLFKFKTFCCNLVVFWLFKLRPVEFWRTSERREMVKLEKFLNCAIRYRYRYNILLWVVWYNSNSFETAFIYIYENETEYSAKQNSTNRYCTRFCRTFVYKYFRGRTFGSMRLIYLPTRFAHLENLYFPLVNRLIFEKNVNYLSKLI